MADQVICLVDNHVHPGSHLWGEHGVSYLVEWNGKRVLFDTGQTGDVLLHNMKVLDVTFPVDALVLSHGHYDHTGGLPTVLERQSGLSVYAHPDLYAEHLAIHGEQVSPIGPPVDEAALRAKSHLLYSREPIEVVPGIWTSGEIPRQVPFEVFSSRSLVIHNEKGELVPDPVWDDMALVVQASAGLVVLFGCGHAGIINTLRHVRETRQQQVIAIAGGIHLAGASAGRLEATVQAMEELGEIPQMWLGHCTGDQVVAYFASIWGQEKVHFCHAGLQMALE